jgi:uncharacterized protein (TIGR03792 family)
MYLAFFGRSTNLLSCQEKIKSEKQRSPLKNSNQKANVRDILFQDGNKQLKMAENEDFQHCIELLKFKVPPARREEYIHKDAEIWTAALANYPGFLGKQVWLNPKDPTQVILVIHWQTQKQWQAIPQAELNAIEQKFRQELGFNWEMVETAEYQVRKISPQLRTLMF